MSKQKFQKALSDRDKTKSISLDISTFDYQEFAGALTDLAYFPLLNEVKLTGEWCWDDESELPLALGRLKQITSLIISLSEVPPSFLTGEIGEMKSLQKLVINRNEMREIPDSIGDLTSLKYLDLCQTSIRKLPQTIGGLLSLEELICEECLLTGVPDEICNLKRLKKLSLDGSFPVIPERLGELTQLLLCGKFISIPANLAGLPKLSKVYLRGRFGNISKGYYSNSQPFVRETLSADISSFNAASQVKWEEFKKTEKPIPWLFIDDVRVLFDHALDNILVKSSFTKVALPGEERKDSNMQLSPSGTYSPTVFVSEAIPNESPQAIDGLLPIGVMEFPIHNEAGRITGYRDERVRIKSIVKNSEAAVTVARIELIVEDKTDATVGAMSLKETFFRKNDNYLTPKGMTKAKREKVILKFEEDFKKAALSNRASFMIAQALPLSLLTYLDRQLLLLDPDEQARVQRLLKVLK
jgi:hypothetical protein